jgi:hypothetical protein
MDPARLDEMHLSHAILLYTLHARHREFSRLDRALREDVPREETFSCLGPASAGRPMDYLERAQKSLDAVAVGPWWRAYLLGKVTRPWFGPPLGLGDGGVDLLLTLALSGRSCLH